MNQLEKLENKFSAEGCVLVIPEYKCRKCGTTFTRRPIPFPVNHGYYTTFHLECHVFCDCSEDYVGIADLQGFTEIK